MDTVGVTRKVNGVTERVSDCNTGRLCDLLQGRSLVCVGLQWGYREGYREVSVKVGQLESGLQEGLVLRGEGYC